MFFLQLLINGLSLGITYGIFAVGFGLIITTTGIFHIAHGAIFLTGGYLFFISIKFFGASLLGGIVISIFGAIALGLAVDRLVYRTVSRYGGGMFTIMIVSMGIALLFEAIYMLSFRGLPSVARVEILTFFSLGPATIRWLDVIIGIVGSLIYFCLYIWIYRTNMGLAIRGLTGNAILASIFIDTNRIRYALFAVGSALAGFGGAITAYDSGITPVQGFDALFIGIVALVVGGMGNLVLGTLVGGIILGIVKVLSAYFFPRWFYVIVFSVLVFSIIIRPEGLVSRVKD